MAVDAKSQINIYGQKIVFMIFYLLQRHITFAFYIILHELNLTIY